MLAGVPAAAQETTSSTVPERPLSSYLRSLADNPQSLSALMGAGRAALDLGDAQAALTFFGRAESIAPRDGNIKMWMGSALVQLEQPSAALRFFADAKALGVPEANLARDRGLAYDLSGDPVRAQHDYALVLKQRRDPEVTRRMALSLAISGKRQPALDLLEDQLRQHDRAAWRVRAFVLALTGDVEGAHNAAQSVMPAAQAAAMAPFFARLSSLNMADRAMAVHFGRIAGEGRSLTAQAQPSQAGPNLSAVIQAGRPDARQPVLGTSPASPTVGTANSSDMSSPRRVAANAAPGFSQPPAIAPTQSANGSASRPIAQAVAQPQIPLPPGEAVQTNLAQTSLAQTLAAGNPPATQAAQIPPPPAPAQAQIPVQAQVEPPSSEAPPTKLSMADIAAAIATLRDDPPSQSTAPTARKPGSKPAVARRPELASAAAPAKARPTEPPARGRERHWVQVAGGVTKAAMPREYARLKVKAPVLLGKRAAWTTPLNATNRLLVGPFESDKDAQAFVNELAKVDVAAFSWTSPAGQEIERLPTK